MLPGDAEPNLRRLTDEVIGTRDIWLVFHPDVAKIARVRTVIDFVTEFVGARGAVATRRADAVTNPLRPPHITAPICQGTNSLSP